MFVWRRSSKRAFWCPGRLYPILPVKPALLRVQVWCQRWILGFQQFIGEFFGSYRVIEGPRGWLDLLAGFRYTYLGQQVGLQANNMAIDAASTQLVDQFAQQLATPGSDLRTLVQRNIADKLGALDGNNPKLPVGPIAADQKDKIADLVQQVIESQQPELAAAIRAGAQARVNQLKAQLANQVANTCDETAESKLFVL